MSPARENFPATARLLNMQPTSGMWDRALCHREPVHGRRENTDKLSHMEISKLAGKPAEPSLLINVPRLVTAYYTGRPDPSVPAQRVVLGTSGHRGSAFDNAVNDAHILAITQALCLYRKQQRHEGQLSIGHEDLLTAEP